MQSEESIHSLPSCPPLYLKEVTQLVYRSEFGEQVATVGGEEDQLARRLSMLRHNHWWPGEGRGGGRVVWIQRLLDCPCPPIQWESHLRMVM